MSRSCRSSARKTRRPMPALASARDGEPASRKIAIEVRPSRRGDAVEDRGRRQARPRRRERQQLGLQETQRLAEQRCRAKHDRAAAAKRAAAGDADQRGIGERIAEQALHDRAGRGEQAADHRGRRDPGDPDRPQHELVARGHGIGGCVAGKAERGGQPREGNAGRADGQRGDRDGRERQRRSRGSATDANRRPLPARRAGYARQSDRHAHCRQFAADRPT